MPFLHFLLISVSSLLCIYQENSIPVFLQAADKNHRLSCGTRPVGWLALVCSPATWNSDPRKSHEREVLVLLDFNVL